MIKKNRLIAIWGNVGSGKTTVALKLAKELTQRKKNVLVILADCHVPQIETIVPFTTIPSEKSLGLILAKATISQADILNACVAEPNNEYLAFISYLQGENGDTYARYTSERAEDFLIHAKHLADYVIVDCDSFLQHKPLSDSAIQVADQVIRLCGASNKANAFFHSQLKTLSDYQKYKPKDHLKVLTSVQGVAVPKNNYNDYYGGTRLELPYTAEIEQQTVEAKRLENFRHKQSQQYQINIEKLANILVPRSEEQTGKDKQPKQIKFGQKQQSENTKRSKIAKPKKKLQLLPKKKVNNIAK